MNTSQNANKKTIKAIGHDARKPIVSLIATANMLLANMAGDISEESRREIEKMKGNAEAALAQLDKLIEHCKTLNND